MADDEGADELVIDSPDMSPVDDEDLEDIDELQLADGAGGPAAASTPASRDRDGNRENYLTYPQSLPYQCESLAEMDAQLQVIIQRISQAVQAKDYDIGLLVWSHRLDCWLSLKYPMKRKIRAKLARLFYELAVMPGMDPRIIEAASATCVTLLANKKRLDIIDLQLPWEPLHAALEVELFPKKRKFGLTNISITLLSLTEYCQRFFPPHEAPKMLDTFLPRLDGSSLNSILACQSFMAHFLPISHPQSWLDPAFVLWESFVNSQIFTEQWLDVMSRLAEKHVDPSVSDPKLIERYSRLAHRSAVMLAAASRTSDGRLQPNGHGKDVTKSPTPETEPLPGLDVEMQDAVHPKSGQSAKPESKWQGVRKDVGIFTHEQWDLLMEKTLSAMGIPVGNVRKSGASFLSQGGEVGAANADAAANATVMKMQKPSEKLHSLAILLVYSMSPDSPILDKTPAGSKAPSRSLSKVSVPDATLGMNGLSSSINGTHTASGRASKPQIGGSRALDSLVKFVNATETFFHPSNYGVWTIALARFLQNVLWEFTKRWIEEERSDCKTPKEWRLTIRIRREFVLVTRQVALLAMFSKDRLSQGCAHSALKSMSFLEPSLVLPAVLERSFPALQGLVETHRTEACMGALAAVALPMISRSNYPAGSKNLLPLLELCIPGLDVNDPIKTLSTVVFVMQALATVKIDDLTRRECIDEASGPGHLDGVREATPPPPEIEIEDVDMDAQGVVLSRVEEDALTRDSTADFPEWIVKFFKAVLALYDHLPDPGRSGKAGGKMEESMIGTITVACDLILGRASPEIYDVALSVFTKHVIGSPRVNSARAVGHLAACFGRADPAKSLAAFLPVCIDKINIELDNGASSTRTTSSSTPIESDNALHWYCLILLGSVHMAADDAIQYKRQTLDILKLMRDKCFSERGYTFTARILQALLGSLSSVWPREYRSANPEEWNSQDYLKRSHLHWGRDYTAAEVKIDWHVPSNGEIEYACEIIQEVVVPAVEKLDELVTSSGSVGKEWRNDFNRYTNLVRAAMTGISTLTGVVDPVRPGIEASDQGDEDKSFLADAPRCAYGAALSDPSDPRLQMLYGLKDRVQHIVHKAFVKMTSVQDKSEDAIDSIKMAISTSKHLMLNHPSDRASHDGLKSNFIFMRDMSKYTVNQKRFPRIVWVRRAALYHASRMRLNTFYRKRSEADDLLIQDIAELAMSPYVSVRKVAQRALDAFTLTYDGTKTLLLDRFFNALQPGNDPDRMKGALYVLGGKSFGNMAILDWSIGPTYIRKLLQCQHEQKPSVQQLVKVVTSDFIIRLAEPSTLKLKISSINSQDAAHALEKASMQPTDEALFRSLCMHSQRRIDTRNAEYEKLIPDLLAVAQDSSSHWRYVLASTRFLRSLIRRDQPLNAELCTYMLSQTVSELPHQRTSAIVAATKLLHFIKLRTFCETEEDLLLQKSKNPLKISIDVPVNINHTFTEAFLQRYRQPLTPESVLVDKHNTGWLVWGRSYDAYRVPAEGDFAWDPSSAAAIEAMRQQVLSTPFWESMLRNLSQESSRDYLAADNVTIVKSIFQIYRDAPLDVLLPLLTKVLEDNDRHKQRAAAEVIGGLMRGAKHWAMPKQQRVYDWLAPQWPKIFDRINLDTQPCWEMLVEYVLGNRDPRRCESLMGFLTKLKIDIDSSEAFKEARKGYLLGSTMKSLSWHFSPWVPDFADTFWDAITSPYTEVRLAISDNLRYLSELRLHPSFPSTQAFLEACYRKDGMHLLIEVDEEYVLRVENLVVSLGELRKIRKPFSKDAVQPYDSACLTILTWLWSGMNDYRVATIYPFVARLLPELMHMQDMQDNQELQKWANVVLAAMAALPYPASRVPIVLDSLLALFESQSWRTRLTVLPLLQVFFFHQLFALEETHILKVVTTLCDLLKDVHIEVREAAATTLSGIIRCSQRDSVLEFKDRFLKELKRIPVLGKKDIAKSANNEEFQDKLIDAHAAVLGASALVLAWPYDVPAWLPQLMLAAATKFSASRAPVSTTVKDMLAQFRKTHQDTWTEDQAKFSTEQLQDLNDLVIGTSYYA